MLQRIRDRISGWIAGVIIALVGGAFILFGIEFYFEQGAANQGEVAKVNGVTITDHQVNNLFSNIQRQAMAQMGNRALSADEEQQLKSYALQSIITQTALLTTLQDSGFHVGLTQVKAMVEQAPDFQVQGKFSQDKFMQAMYGLGLSPYEFFQQLQTRWIVQQATKGVADAGFALPNEVNHFYSLAHQKRSFGYMTVPMQSFMAKVQIAEKDIADNYKNNQQTYETQPKVSVAYILLSPTDIEKTVKITDSEAKAYYESHMPAQNTSDKKTSFAAEKNNIVTLLQRQHVNQLLSDKSSQLSDLTYTNPDSLEAASKALNLPIQTTPMMTKAGDKSGIFANPKVLAAVFSDSVYQSGNNSNPLALQNGEQIVLRIAKKEPSQPIPLKTVHDQIKLQLQKKQAEAQAGLLAYQLQKKMLAGADPVALAKQNGLQWHAISLVSADQKSSVPSEILSAAFATPVSKQQGQFIGSQAISYNKQDYVVIAISTIENANPSHLSSSDNKKMSAQLSSMWGQLYEHCFVDSVMKQAKIKILQH